MNENPPTVTG